jgi:hypothetical protein
MWVSSMAISSKASITFDHSARTAEDLRTFWNEDPLGAAQWLRKVGRAARNSVGPIDQVAQILAQRTADSFKAQALRELAASTPQLFDIVGAFGESLPVKAMGWDAAPNDWMDPPEFTGTLKLNEQNNPVLETERGIFKLSYLGGASGWRDEVETAFLNQVVTIKGYPSADGTGLAIAQFGPGATGDFISGRIQVEGGKVYVSPTGSISQAAEIVDPELKRLLAGDPTHNLVPYNPAGVILPGRAEMEEGRFVYKGTAADGFYILGRIMRPNVLALPSGEELHLFETGYFRNTDAIAPADMPIGADVLPNAVVGPPGDFTSGSTQPNEGRRTFFFIKILPPEVQIPGATLTNVRRFEVRWVGHASDQGTHFSVVVATNLRDVARAVPAAVPASVTEAQAGFKPEGIKPFVAHAGTPPVTGT